MELHGACCRACAAWEEEEVLHATGSGRAQATLHGKVFAAPEEEAALHAAVITKREETCAPNIESPWCGLLLALRGWKAMHHAHAGACTMHMQPHASSSNRDGRPESRPGAVKGRPKAASSQGPTYGREQTRADLRPGAVKGRPKAGSS
eukprot:179159-Chlamydomonas_euryale.AAC.2